jgi:hypothetical protein
LEFRTLSLTESARDGLVSTFGQEWLDRYMARAVDNLEAWRIGCDGGVQ